MGKKEKHKNLLGLQFGEGHEYIIKREILGLSYDTAQ